jgi:hypothetical protein
MPIPPRACIRCIERKRKVSLVMVDVDTALQVFIQSYAPRTSATTFDLAVSTVSALDPPVRIPHHSEDGASATPVTRLGKGDELIRWSSCVRSGPLVGFSRLAEDRAIACENALVFLLSQPEVMACLGSMTQTASPIYNSYRAHADLVFHLTEPGYGHSRNHK